MFRQAESVVILSIYYNYFWKQETYTDLGLVEFLSNNQTTMTQGATPT
jgi:hypothetical protein